MQNESPDQDDPTSKWPPEVKEAYKRLEAPSLYDCVLTNEKLSLELRKQNKEVKSINEEIQSISLRINVMMQIFEEDLEIYEVDDEDEDDGSDLEEGVEPEKSKLNLRWMHQSQKEIQNQAVGLLMETSDSMVELSKHIRQTIDELIRSISFRKGLFAAFSFSNPSPLPEKLTRSILEQVDDVRYHTIRRLDEWGVDLIEPHPGDVFNASYHHALESVTGGNPGTIARVVRLGYRKKEAVIRSADVVIYS